MKLVLYCLADPRCFLRRCQKESGVLISSHLGTSKTVAPLLDDLLNFWQMASRITQERTGALEKSTGNGQKNLPGAPVVEVP